MTTQTMTRISLEAGCDFEECAKFAFPLHRQLRNGYETCSVLPVPESVEAWRDDHRTARKRSDRATRLGYQFREIAREDYGDGINEINWSKDERQGRPMSRAYREEQNFLPLPEYPCERHAFHTYGVLDTRGTLAAYLWLYRVGELALVSTILGHKDHEPNGVIQRLFHGVLTEQIHLGGYFVYNRWDSGQDGLRQAKGWLGFEPMEVTWEL